MVKRYYSLLLCCLFFIGCGEKRAYGEESGIKILRFDRDLYSYLSGEMPQEELLEAHKEFLDLYGEAVVGIGKSDSAGFFPRLNSFFSHAALRQLYKDQLETFSDLSGVEDELSSAFEFLKLSFDSLSIPAIYIHTSGLNQNMIVSDRFLSISADKYLGEDYPLYVDYFYDYQRQQMTPQRLAPDLLLGFLMSVFPPHPNGETLLDGIVYEGKLRYLLSLALPGYSDAEIIGYTTAQEEWSEQNEGQIWKRMLEEKHLFSKDKLLIGKYINDAPYTAPISDLSPGRLGVWTGFQIVKSYMKEAKGQSLQDLMNHTDAQEILRISKYKP